MRSQLPKPYQGEKITIAYGKWSDKDSNILRWTSRWEVKKLQLNDNGWATLVKELSHISFPNLTQLHISGNKIQSIQILSKIGILHIKLLYLDNNNISSVRGMRKSYWPSLFTLHLDNNYFGDIKHLVQGCFLELKFFGIYGNWRGEQKNLHADPFFSAKLQTHQLQYLGIREERFSIDRSITKALEKKQREAYIQ